MRLGGIALVPQLDLSSVSSVLAGIESRRQSLAGERAHKRRIGGWGCHGVIRHQSNQAADDGQHRLSFYGEFHVKLLLPLRAANEIPCSETVKRSADRSPTPGLA